MLFCLELDEDYNNANRINIISLTKNIEDEIKSNRIQKLKMLENKENEKKLKDTLIINIMLQLTKKEIIEKHIISSIAQNKQEIIIYHSEKSGDFVKFPDYTFDSVNYDNILDTPISKLNIYHDELDETIINENNINKSIIEIIEDLLPIGYRIYNMYAIKFNKNKPFYDLNGHKIVYEIVIRSDSYICNDTCLFFLCCKQKSQCYYCLSCCIAQYFFGCFGCDCSCIVGP